MRIKNIAIHEAAHASICLQYKIPFVEVTMLQKKETLGSVMLENKYLKKIIEVTSTNELHIVSLRKYLECLLAGYIAENKVNSKEASIGASKDFDIAFSICTQLFPNVKTINAFLHYIICEVENNFTYLLDEENNQTEDTP